METFGQIVAGIVLFVFFIGFIYYRHRQDLRAEQRAKGTPPGRV